MLQLDQLNLKGASNSFIELMMNPSLESHDSAPGEPSSTAPNLERHFLLFLSSSNQFLIDQINYYCTYNSPMREIVFLIP